MGVLNIADRQIADIGLDHDGTKPEELPTHSWYIIADVVDFGQLELDNVATKKTVLGHLAQALIGQDKDREIPHQKPIRKEDKANHQTSNRQQKQLELRLPDKWRNRRDDQRDQ